MDTVRTSLAELTSTAAEDWHLVFKARYGMQQVFAALNAASEVRGVVTQSLTCATAVDPIMVAGQRPVYGDISEQSLALDPDRLPAPASWGAVVIQHTFGIVDAARSARLAAAARANSALVVEDSAHALGRMVRSADGTPLADVSIHSFGAEKSLPTKFGGAIWVNPEMADTAVREDITRRLESMRPPGSRLALAARTYRLQMAVLRRLPGGVGRATRRALTSAKLFEPPVAPSEQEGRLAHSDVGASPWVVGHMSEHLPGLAALEATRIAAVGVYAKVLSDLMPWSADVVGQPLIRMPLLTPDAVDTAAVVDALRDRGIYVGTWYRPALFPGVADPEAYCYDPNDPNLSVTRDVIERIVNLPTSVTEAEAERIARDTLDVLEVLRNAST
ncbi:DegT/DnrJ/EryC1/StrS family aminotransferase [Demequina aurantiaca]|uniref:DegT/DnrJ/EryC1/StrS family aminotransferase n=1 Tax=Demequina aurantiaca TaxID=676200 RepID=UPI0007834673|nr:DegT/DnrJ/EryC1/StrS family aminotransferase [Demequina aurantiaca]